MQGAGLQEYEQLQLTSRAAAVCCGWGRHTLIKNADAFTLADRTTSQALCMLPSMALI